MSFLINTIFLDSGTALLFFGTPILAFILSLVIALLETFYLNLITENFSLTFKSALLANLASTVLGFGVMALLNYFQIISSFSDISGFTLKSGHGISTFFGRTLILLFFYLITILIEIPIFKYFLRLFPFPIAKEVSIANGVSYGLLWFLFVFII